MEKPHGERPVRRAPQPVRHARRMKTAVREAGPWECKMPPPHGAGADRHGDVEQGLEATVLRCKDTTVGPQACARSQKVRHWAHAARQDAGPWELQEASPPTMVRRCKVTAMGGEVPAAWTQVLSRCVGQHFYSVIVRVAACCRTGLSVLFTCSVGLAGAGVLCGLVNNPPCVN